MSIHEFDVALAPGIATPITATRRATRELHLNVWLVGTKGFGPIASTGDSTVTPATGIVLASARPVGMANAPTELVIGDTAAAPSLLNLAESFTQTSATPITLSGFFIS